MGPALVLCSRRQMPDPGALLSSVIIGVPSGPASPFHRSPLFTWKGVRTMKSPAGSPVKLKMFSHLPSGN